MWTTLYKIDSRRKVIQLYLIHLVQFLSNLCLKFYNALIPLLPQPLTRVYVHSLRQEGICNIHLNVVVYIINEGFVFGNLFTSHQLQPSHKNLKVESEHRAAAAVCHNIWHPLTGTWMHSWVQFCPSSATLRTLHSIP